jgi:hypothetical protein
MRHTPLQFTDEQVRQLQRAAASVPEACREKFVADVAAHLAGAPSDLALSQAINNVLDNAAAHFFCDSLDERK